MDSGVDVNLLLWLWNRLRPGSNDKRNLPTDGDAPEPVEESVLDWCLALTRSPDPGERKTGIIGVAAYGVAAIQPLLALTSEPNYIPTAVTILERIAERGDRAAVLDAMFQIYGGADPATKQRIIDAVASLQTAQPSPPPAPAVEPEARRPQPRTRTPPVVARPSPAPRIDGHGDAASKLPTGSPSRPGVSGDRPREAPLVPSALLIGAIEKLLSESAKPMRARVIARELVRAGHPNLDRRSVNRMLYTHLDRFEQDANWEWSLRGATRPMPVEAQVEDLSLEVEPAPIAHGLPPEVTDDGRLYPWQAQALAAWYDSGERGIIQAITGAGKTRLGLAAIERHLRDPAARAAVVVPTVVLLNQWKGELAAWLGARESEIGQCGGGSNDDLSDARVTVYVVNSAAQYLANDVDAAGGPVLLVADECHRYGADSFRAAIQGSFVSTLGLSATPERAFDLAMDEAVIPAIGPVVFRYDYESALRDGVISDFDVAFVALEFTSDEATEYEALDADVTRLKRAVESKYPELRRGASQAQYFAILTRLAKSDEEGSVRAYLDRLAARKNWVIQASAREQFVEWFIRDARQGSRTFVFHENIAGADWIAEALTDAGVPAASHHSGKSLPERQAILQAFRDNALHAITAARTLDEGVDVPDANVAVIAAGSSVTRQQIQRAGRVLRKVRGKKAKIVRLYVAGSREDPELVKGGSEFENMMASLGRSSRFRWPAQAAALVQWLGEGQPTQRVVATAHAAAEPARAQPAAVSAVRPPQSPSDLVGRRAGYWGSPGDWPTAAAIVAGAGADATGPQWALENPSALEQIRSAFEAGDIELLAMTRISSWPFTGKRGWEAMSGLHVAGRPIYFVFEGVLSTSADGWIRIQSKLRPRETPSNRESAPAGIDPDLWEQEAGWRDFRRNWPRKP